MSAYIWYLLVSMAGWCLAVGLIGAVAAARYRLAVDLYYNDDDDVKAVDVTVVRR